ncbi:hypothetical protein C900_05300 [Fulvivirga imtechensis AK7]|uniref:Uncharacterized protein n=1 Tax=Fulvivirga imtechensis AK7 TaxID=1237149 RepID=L8JP01_9BACT|nr:hypothetical protein [Fulvivirga imtechensis]ELR69229.1 hypothetical protein C900_05300 [Fulvivirga imtechensis AK7]
MKCLSIILLFLIYASLTFGQDYVVTVQGDTLRGTIHILLPTETHEEIAIDTGEKNEKLKAFQLLELNKDGVQYRSVKFGKIYKIMEVRTSGYLSLFYFRSENQYSFGSPYLLKKTGEGIEISTLMFKKMMTGFLSDCPEVAGKIEDKTYKKGDLSQIISEYNQCITSQTKAAFNSSAPESTEPATKISSDNPAIGSIRSIKEEIKQARVEASDIVTLLNDVEQKLSKGDKVPSYMISALKDQAAEFDFIIDDVNKLIELIK